MEIKKVYKEQMPPLSLIGKRYTDADRDDTGTFARYWQQCFAENWPAALQACAPLQNAEQGLVGAMRMTGEAGGFEYWIGLFCAPEAEAPEGFERVTIPAGEVGVCWLYGSDKTGELYGPEASDLSMAALAENGWKFDENGWFFERYNCPRFTQPDAQGNVILDICTYLV